MTPKTYTEPKINLWIRKLNGTARTTGFTTSLVKREGQYIITIAPREGDVIIMRKNGKLGMYTPKT